MVNKLHETQAYQHKAIRELNTVKKASDGALKERLVVRRNRHTAIRE